MTAAGGSERFAAAVVGAGQAGLAVSRLLTERGVDHVVLEGARIGEAWRRRWDSFCLVTPNWSVQLPGRPYDGDDPDGFMPRDPIVRYLESYAASFAAPVVAGARVTSLGADGHNGFRLETTVGPFAADAVIVCSGAYQRPHRPPAARTLPPGLLQLDVDGYRNPDDLPPGAVLVVGSGQSGCQIAEDLHRAGRDVSLACGRAGWAPRAVGGRDVFWWLDRSGELDSPLSALADPADRLLANLQATGRDGGHDLHYRTLRRAGVTLLGHFVGAHGREACFAADLGATVAWGDQRHEKLMGTIRAVAARLGLEVDIPPPEPFDGAAPERLNLRGFGAVVFAGGFRPDYGSWVRWPHAFDGQGFPVQEEGASTVVAGLYFVGVHYLRTRKSSLLLGVGEDAARVADAVAARSGQAASCSKARRKTPSG